MTINDLIKLLRQAIHNGVDPNLRVHIMCEMKDPDKEGYFTMEGPPVFVAIPPNENRFCIVSTDDKEGLGEKGRVH